MDRRGFLKAAATGAAGLALGACDSKFWNIFDKGSEDLWGLNVHPYGGNLIDVQLRALRELRLGRIRITLGLRHDLAGPYLSGYPAEYVGIVGDFGPLTVSPAEWPHLVRQTVSRAPGVRFFEILNEPMNITPEVYVNDYLRPAYEIIRELRPDAKVAAAAPTGTSDGRIYFLRLREAGADRWCDYRAAHLYSDDPELYLAGTDKGFLITETGISEPARHVHWWQDTMAHISGVLDTKRLYFYVLMDQPDTGFNLISSAAARDGRIQPVSPLYDYIKRL